MSALTMERQLEDLPDERVLAEVEGLGDDAAFMLNLEVEIAVVHAAFVHGRDRDRDPAHRAVRRRLRRTDDGRQIGGRHRPSTTRKEQVMSQLKTLTASALAVAALTPVAASAAEVELRSAPSMRLVDARQANLSFTTDDRLTRKADGTYRIRIVFASAKQKVSSVVARGRHGDDYRYSARVTSTSDLRVGAKYTVRFGDDGITRLVKLQPRRS